MQETPKYFQLNREEIIRQIGSQELKRWWLAEVTGVHVTTLRRWLSGRIGRVRAPNVRRLADVLTVDSRLIAEPTGVRRPFSGPSKRPGVRSSVLT
jgi:hypothetical protein